MERPRPRDRRLAVRERGRSGLYVSAARALAYRIDLYDMKDELAGGLPPNALDRTFNAYERRLSAAYEALAQSSGTLDFEIWMEVLIPFIAGITVRHPTYLANAPEPVLIQMSRLHDMTRVLAPLMAAGWYLIDAPDDANFLISDLGYMPTLDPATKQPGLFIPVGLRTALQIWSNPTRGIARKTNKGWITPLPRRMLTSEEVTRINDGMARFTPSWIAGPTPDHLEGVPLEATTPPSYPAFPPGWPPIGPLGSHDRAWDVTLNMAGLQRTADDWTPVGILSSMVPGVRLIDDAGVEVIAISLELPTDPPD
jgi:hypothetical protein